LFDQYPFLRVPVTGDIRPQTVVQNMIERHASERTFYYTNIATAPWMQQRNLSASEGLLWRVADAKKTGEELSVERINRLWSGYRLRSLDPPACGYWDEYTDVMKDSYGVGLTLLGPYCLVRGMPQQGIWSLQNALKYRSPQVQWPLHSMLSEFHLMLHDASSALVEAQMVLKLQPGNPYGFVRMGQAFLGLGNLEGARQSFDMALRIAPQFPEAQQGMSYVDQLGRMGGGNASVR
jgi:tetratricopeptide (TPR) repeat protein